MSTRQTRVFITRRLPAAGPDLLKKRVSVLNVSRVDRDLTRKELLAGVKGCHGLITMLSDKIDGVVMDAAGPQLRVIANYAVGYNNIDVAAAARRGITVTNTPGVLTDATADLAWALLFAAARRVVESDAYVRAGKWSAWGPELMLGADITGKTLGIVGAGRIGSAFALKSAGFNMKVLYVHPRKNPVLEKKLKAKRVTLPTLLKQSDFVSFHVPLTPKTNGMVGRKELALMKKNAVLVNTARGQVIDERALIDVLKKKKIAGVGLDVFEKEPAVPASLKKLKNTVLAPHIGSGSIETRTEMSRMAARNVIAVLAGKKALNPVT